MSKLGQRLSDARRSGVYRARDPAPIMEATAGSGLDVVAIDASGNALQKIAKALAFPEWFGDNWDALEDSLGDLSWRKAEGHVLVFTGYPEDSAVLIKVLRSSAEFWMEQGKPFFAVFVDPAQELALPPLYRER
jgi:hypothetical protein